MLDPSTGLPPLVPVAPLPVPAAEAPPEPRRFGRPGVGLHLLAIVLALAGGVLGVAGAFVREVESLSGGIVLAFVAAPVIEEALKPAGIYILLIRWPQALAGRLHIAALTALSGLCFGLIESASYVWLRFPDHGNGYVLFRFTAPVALHVIASFLVGLGLSRSLIDWAAGRGPLPKSTRFFYLSGVGLHATYNITVTILSVAGVLTFDP